MENKQVMDKMERFETRILEKIDTVIEKIGSSDEKNQRERGKIWEVTNKTSTDVEVHKKEIYGNGKKGLVTRVEALERKMWQYGGAIIVIVFLLNYVNFNNIFK